MTLDILNSYYMMGLWEGLSPVNTFFRDRYFPTEAGDIYAADKVLCEYRDGDHGMAPFMVERADPIAVGRQGYEIHDYVPVKIAQSCPLTLDDLKKRGFGEAILTNMTEADRAVRIVMEDLERLERRFSRTEEWLCAQTMINNGFSVNEMLDKDTIGNVATVQYYDALAGNDGLYTFGGSEKWSESGRTFADIAGTVRNICRGLTKRGQPAKDLIVGVNVADVLMNNKDFRELADKNSGIIVTSGIEAELSQYDGVTLLGVINFNGYRLNVIVADEQYKAADGTTTNYFPAKSIMVTAPGAGHLMYAHITHIDDAGNYTTITGKRVPDLFVDRKRKTREIILESRPLAAPKNYAPWVYAPNAVA